MEETSRTFEAENDERISREVRGVLNDILDRLEAEDAVDESNDEMRNGGPQLGSSQNGRPILVFQEVDDCYEKLIGQTEVGTKRKFDSQGSIGNLNHEHNSSNVKAPRLDQSAISLSTSDFTVDDEISIISEVTCIVIDD